MGVDRQGGGSGLLTGLDWVRGQQSVTTVTSRVGVVVAVLELHTAGRPAAAMDPTLTHNRSYFTDYCGSAQPSLQSNQFAIHLSGDNTALWAEPGVNS